MSLLFVCCFVFPLAHARARDTYVYGDTVCKMLIFSAAEIPNSAAMKNMVLICHNVRCVLGADVSND